MKVKLFSAKTLEIEKIIQKWLDNNGDVTILNTNMTESHVIETGRVVTYVVLYKEENSNQDKESEYILMNIKIEISGQVGSGKSTICEIIEKALRERRIYRNSSS